MAFSSTSIQPPPKTNPAPMHTEGAASLLAALVLGVLAAQQSKKQLRKLKRKAAVALLRYKVTESFSRIKSWLTKKAPPISNTTLLYLLLGLLVLILIFVEPIVAIAVLLLGILLILLTR